jgi:hypothetical protein
VAFSAAIVGAWMVEESGLAACACDEAKEETFLNQCDGWAICGTLQWAVPANRSCTHCRNALAPPRLAGPCLRVHPSRSRPAFAFSLPWIDRVGARYVARFDRIDRSRFIPRDDITPDECGVTVHNAPFRTGIGPGPRYGFSVKQNLGPIGPVPRSGRTWPSVRSRCVPFRGPVLGSTSPFLGLVLS